MAFVIDASVAACWAFDDESHPVATDALERLRTDDAIVPSLWWFEIWNILISNERRGRLSPLRTPMFLTEISKLGIAIDRSPDQATLLDLARRHRLTAFDAAYLELSLRHGIVLATLDEALIRAAEAEGVPANSF